MKVENRPRVPVVVCTGAFLELKCCSLPWEEEVVFHLVSTAWGRSEAFLALPTHSGRAGPSSLHPSRAEHERKNKK